MVGKIYGKKKNVEKKKGSEVGGDVNSNKE